MAIGFRAQTQIASGGATDPTSAAALPAATATGDMVLAFVIVKYASTTITDPSGWTVVSNNQAANSGLTDSGNDAGNIRAAIYFREKDAGWSTMPAFDLSGTPNATMVGAISYTKGAGEAWVTPVCANAVDNTVSSTGVDPPASSTVISMTTGDLIGSFAAQNGDVGTFSSHNIAVTGITFGAQTTRLGAATSSGTDLRGHSIERPYSSGTASAGPDGSMINTAGGGSDAGVMIFYRLRVGTTVAATMVSACGALAGTMAATVQHPTTVAAVLVAPLGALTATASATVTPRIEAALVSNLGALTATATATRTTPATLASSCGALTATMSATVQAGGVTVNAVLAAPLGQLTATAAATVVPRIEATLTATLGGLTATATATRQHPVTLSAACGGLAATAAATVQHSALGAAPLGTLVATMNATVSLANVVDAVLVADLGQLVALANAGPPPPEPASVGFERFEGPSPAWGEVVSWVDALNERMWEDFQV